jgi:glycosyltransferase involved in cell wall biosynthesis
VLWEELARELSSRAADRTVLYVTVEPDVAAARAVNEAARATAPADLVLLAPGVEVTSGWVGRLADAAKSDSTVATATPLSLTDGSLGLFDDDASDKLTDGVDELARRVSLRGLRLRPRIATVGGECAYLRRSALELVGPLEEALALGPALEDFALRALAAGMVHVAADDVLVAGSRGGRAGAAEREQRSAPPAASDRIQETIVEDERGRLHRAIAVGRIALRRLSVTIDGRALVSAVGGTQTYILDLVLALSREPRLAVRVLVPPDLSERAAAGLREHSSVELLSYEDAVANPVMTDVVHRPQPVFTADDLALLRLVGERLVIGQQDLISYHNYSYHRDVEAWRTYRRTTRLALGAADQVIFFSEHARRDALSEDLLPAARTHVVGVGAEALEPDGPLASPPEGLLADEPFLLCLGADYRHKNRPFAIELVARLRELGWDGRLVLAGPHVPFGSSRERELEMLADDPRLAELVVDLGPVDEPLKRWLFEHAGALVYPTIYEGLGLLPLEAARVGVPCLFAAQASLAELAGRAATLVPWDAVASAAAVMPLLRQGSARSTHLAELRALSGPPWRDVAESLASVYEQAVTAPPSEAAPRNWQELEREGYVGALESEVDHLRGVAQEYQDAYHRLEGRVSPGLPLIDQGGLLTPAQQRGLMRIAGRRGVGAALLAPFGLLGRRDSSDPGARESAEE